MPKPIHRRLARGSLLIGLSGAAALLGAASVHAQQAQPDATQSDPDCPADVPETSIVASPTSDGAALLFLSPRHVAELRRRVRTLATDQNRGAISPLEEEHPSPGEEAKPREPTSYVHEPTAYVYDVDGGAMLKLTPSELDQLADVQARALDYAQRLAGGNCPLLRDETTVLPTDTREPGPPGHIQMPAGIVPGVGGIPTAAPILSPSLTL